MMLKGHDTRVGHACGKQMPAPCAVCAHRPRSDIHQIQRLTRVRRCRDSGNGGERATATLAPPNTTQTPSQQEQPQPSSQPKVDWFDAWWPVAFEVDIDKKRPYRFELLETQLVIWWDPNASSWRVFEDVCPHRLVPLSEGRVNDRGNLECGYHGWEFSGGGKCERIPQGGNAGNPRACARAFPCAARQGLLWVKLKQLPNAITAPPGSDAAMAVAAEVAADAVRIPIVPELDDPSWVPQDTWRDLPFGYDTLMENVMDVSHVPFTHHKSISNRNMIGDFKLSLASPVEPQGFKGVWPTGPRAGKMGTQYTDFVAPGFMKHTLDAEEQRGFSALTVVYSVPMRPGKCRLINRNCTRLTKARFVSSVIRSVPLWLQHVASQVPLEDDQIFLHLGEPTYMQRRIEGQPLARAYFMASPADTLVAAFRKWMDDYAGGGPFGPPTKAMLEAIGPRLSREELLDRYSSHTIQCATCQKGLARVRAVRTAFNAVKVAAAAMALFTAAVAVAHLGLPAPVPVPAAVAPAVAGSGPVLGAGLSALMLGVGAQLAGVDGPAQQMLRALVWAVVAFAASQAASALETMEGKFFRGDWPPMRNTAKDGP